MRTKRSGRSSRPEDVSYDRLRAAIASGELLPNQRLIELELSQSLKVGRTAIRTALARLAQENIVERLPNRGARVRRISEKEAIEILEARMVLEGVAARHAAENATAADIAQLQAIIKEMGRRTADGKAVAYTDTNMRFHREILRIANHATAAAIIENLRSRYAQHQFRVTEVPRDPDARLAQHRAIADAIARHDPEEAERAMRGHLSDIMPGLRAELRRAESQTEVRLAN
jgi:DNA-binding GntR family transcriptional regulator